MSRVNHQSNSSRYQMYLNANKTMNMSPKSHPKFEQIIQKKVMMNNDQRKVNSPSVYNLVAPSDASQRSTQHDFDNQRNMQLSRIM